MPAMFFIRTIDIFSPPPQEIMIVFFRFRYLQIDSQTKSVTPDAVTKSPLNSYGLQPNLQHT